jgi:hypothetical protein
MVIIINSTITIITVTIVIITMMAMFQPFSMHIAHPDEALKG